ncbi:MAG: hypothetical protein IPK79_08720 [Vampirovibrionales bacterium]|nr:hypothetical protein [Vampirovibrionales bacterium]
MKFKSLSILALLLAVAASVSLTGCSKTVNNNPEPDAVDGPASNTTEINVTTPSVTPPAAPEVNVTAPVVTPPAAEPVAEPAKEHGDEHKAD